MGFYYGPSNYGPTCSNTAPVLGFLNNIYEGLVRRDTGMRIEGALAESWEPIGTDGWRFKLRKGVKFHDGSDFDAEDVLFRMSVLLQKNLMYSLGLLQLKRWKS